MFIKGLIIRFKPLYKKEIFPSDFVRIVTAKYGVYDILLSEEKREKA